MSLAFPEAPARWLMDGSQQLTANDSDIQHPKSTDNSLLSSSQSFVQSKGASATNYASSTSGTLGHNFPSSSSSHVDTCNETFNRGTKSPFYLLIPNLQQM